MPRSPYRPRPGRRPEAPDALDHDAFVGWFLSSLTETSSGGDPDHMVLTGLPGCGKSSLVEACCVAARQRGFAVIEPDTQEGEFAGSLHDELIRAHPNKKIGAAISSLGITGFGINATFSRNTSPYGINALASLLAQTAHAQNRFRKQGGVIIRVDDMDRLAFTDLTKLSKVLQRLKQARYANAPVVLLGAARPGMRNQATANHTDYEFIPLRDRLTPTATEVLLQAPAARIGRHWHNDAIGLAGRETLGHPAYLQILADETWHTSRNVVINHEDVLRAIPTAQEQFTGAYLTPRWRELTSHQQAFLTALAAHGGTSTHQHITNSLNIPASKLAEAAEQLETTGLTTYHPSQPNTIQTTDQHLSRHALTHYPRLQDKLSLPSLEQLRAHAPHNHNQPQPQPQRQDQPQTQPQPQNQNEDRVQGQAQGTVLDPELKQIMELHRAGSPTPPTPTPPGKNNPRTTPRRGTTPPTPRRGLER